MGITLKQGRKVSCGCLPAERLARRAEQWDDVPSRTTRRVITRSTRPPQYTDKKPAWLRHKRSAACKAPKICPDARSRGNALCCQPEETQGSEGGRPMSRPCIKCGSTDRNARGNCIACQRRRSLARRSNPVFRERNLQRKDPCIKCGSTEWSASGHCAECQRRRQLIMRANPAYRERNLKREDPCAKCGGTVWYANGHCAECARRRAQRLRAMWSAPAVWRLKRRPVAARSYPDPAHMLWEGDSKPVTQPAIRLRRRSRVGETRARQSWGD